LEKLGIERFHIVRSKSKEKKVSVVKDLKSRLIINDMYRSEIDLVIT